MCSAPTPQVKSCRSSAKKQPQLRCSESWLCFEAFASHLVSLQVAHPLCDGRLHVAALVLQLVVLLAEVLLLLQQGGVASCQFLLVDLQHRELPQRFTELSPDFLRVLVKSAQELLIAKTGRKFWGRPKPNYKVRCNLLLMLVKGLSEVYLCSQDSQGLQWRTGNTNFNS